MLEILCDVMSDDSMLYNFFSCLLSSNKAYLGDELLTESRGVMVGVPIAPFLANLYLRELDSYFVARNIPYARYSDDIIFFGKTEEKILHYKEIVYKLLRCYKLTVNQAKEKITPPGEAWEFLGISYENGMIDLSTVTRKKLKGKIKRKAWSLERWMHKKNIESEKAMQVLIRIFNRKFFEGSDANDLTWARWFFPLITKHDGLREIDLYLQQYI
jgi:hypothetical protein